VNCLQAFMQRDMGGLKYRSHPNRELLPATRLIALPQAKPGFAVLTLDALKPARAANYPAFRADNAVFPEQFFEVPEGRFFVVKVDFCENGHDGNPIAAVTISILPSNLGL
jgi:hypothetical protein